MIDPYKLFNKAEIGKTLGISGPLITLIAQGKYERSLEAPKAARCVRVLAVMERFAAELEKEAGAA